MHRVVYWLLRVLKLIICSNAPKEAPLHTFGGYIPVFYRMFCDCIGPKQRIGIMRSGQYCTLSGLSYCCAVDVWFQPWEALTENMLPSGAIHAAADTDKSQLKTADVNSLFPGDARIQPLPLPLGPAYNNSNFKAYLNVTVQMYTDQPRGSFSVNQSVLSNLVNGLGRLYYPQGVLFEVWLHTFTPSLSNTIHSTAGKRTPVNTSQIPPQSLQLANAGTGSHSCKWERLDGRLHHSGRGTQLGPVRQHADDAAG